jgi:hypothetical protein
VDIKKTIDSGFNACTEAIIKWPLMNNKHWVKSRREEFFGFVGNYHVNNYQPVALACMIERIIADLQDRERGGRMAPYLVPIAAASKVIHDFCDPTGANFPAYELSDKLLDELYEIIELREFA